MDFQKIVIFKWWDFFFRSNLIFLLIKSVPLYLQYQVWGVSKLNFEFRRLAPPANRVVRCGAVLLHHTYRLCAMQECSGVFPHIPALLSTSPLLHPQCLAGFLEAYKAHTSIKFTIFTNKKLNSVFFFFLTRFQKYSIHK